MKEYRVTEKQLKKLSLYLEELSGVHKDMGDYDICVNPFDLEDAKKKLNETIRDLGFLVEDIEGQEVEAVKRPVTLLEVVGASVSIRRECPGASRHENAFRSAGYKQPDLDCPRRSDGKSLSCSDCWNRLAEPLEDDGHAR